MKIKIKEIDDEISFFGGRVLKVNRKFLTPYRVSSSVEYRSKQQVPTATKIDSEFSEVTSIFNIPDFQKFTSESDAYLKRIRGDEQKADLTIYSDLVSYFPQLSKDIKPDEKGMKLILELGLNLPNVNIVSIPSFEPLNSYDTELKQYSEYILSRGKEPMPLIDMGLPKDEFKSKFDEISSNVETGLVSVIGLIYRNWKSNIQNYYYIWENRNLPVLYYCLGVDRTFEQGSAMHFLQSWGIDVYSIRMRKGYGSYRRKLNNVEIFDRDTIGVLKYNKFIDKYSDGHFNCNCPMCKGAEITEFVDEYGHNHEGEIDPSKLQYAGKLHEYYSSSEEFNISRRAILENSLSSYFDSKEYLNIYRRKGNLDGFL